MSVLCSVQKMSKKTPLDRERRVLPFSISLYHPHRIHRIHLGRRLSLSNPQQLHCSGASQSILLDSELSVGKYSLSSLIKRYNLDAKYRPRYPSRSLSELTAPRFSKIENGLLWHVSRRFLEVVIGLSDLDSNRGLHDTAEPQ